MTSLTALMGKVVVLGLVVTKGQIQAFLLNEMVSPMAITQFF